MIKAIREELRCMNEKLKEFTEALASTEPTPGGGGAAAAMGALAAALGCMASRLSERKKSCAENAQRLREIAARCDALRLAFQEQIEADEAAFLPLYRAYRLAKDAPDRRETLRRASLDACAAALEMLRLGAQTARLLTELRELSGPALLSDVGCAAAACRAALLCAAMNVYVNTAPYPDDGEAAALKQFVESVLLESLPLAEETELQILLHLRDGEK